MKPAGQAHPTTPAVPATASAGGPGSRPPGERWGVGLLPVDDPARRGSRSPVPATALEANSSGRGGFWSWLRPRVAAGSSGVPFASTTPKGALWTIGLEWRGPGANQPPVMIARLRARTPSSNLLLMTQLLTGAAALLAERGRAIEGGTLSALPVLKSKPEHPARPADWTGPSLELWFDGFVGDEGQGES